MGFSNISYNVRALTQIYKNNLIDLSSIHDEIVDLFSKCESKDIIQFFAINMVDLHEPFHITRKLFDGECLTKLIQKLSNVEVVEYLVHNFVQELDFSICLDRGQPRWKFELLENFGIRTFAQ